MCKFSNHLHIIELDIYLINQFRQIFNFEKINALKFEYKNKIYVVLLKHYIQIIQLEKYIKYSVK